jgi:hypothetical protein
MVFSRHLLGTVLGLGALAVSALPGAAIASLGRPADSTSTRVGCMPQTYRGAYRVTTFHRHPRLTHVALYVIGPSGSHTVTKTAAFETKVTAGAELNAGGSVGADEVFAKVEAHFNVTVRVEGSHTQSGSISVTDVVSNPTRRNKVFIAFDGVTVYSGHYFLRTCGADRQVHRRYGHYRSFNNFTEGIPRCGAGDGGSAITHLALRRCGS